MNVAVYSLGWQPRATFPGTWFRIEWVPSICRSLCHAYYTHAHTTTLSTAQTTKISRGKCYTALPITTTTLKKILLLRILFQFYRLLFLWYELNFPSQQTSWEKQLRWSIVDIGRFEELKSTESCRFEVYLLQQQFLTFNSPARELIHWVSEQAKWEENPLLKGRDPADWLLLSLKKRERFTQAQLVHSFTHSLCTHFFCPCVRFSQHFFHSRSISLIKEVCRLTYYV